MLSHVCEQNLEQPAVSLVGIEQALHVLVFQTNVTHPICVEGRRDISLVQNVGASPVRNTREFDRMQAHLCQLPPPPKTSVNGE